MKKFSTATLFPALLSLAVLSFAPAHAASADGASPSTSRCAFRAEAPDQHLVVRGDTLWDISGKFLEHPWCWPQVWGMNREQIRNPHWIYPGQIVYLDRAAGRLRLGSPVGNGGAEAQTAGVPTVRLSPQLRTEAIGKDAVPSIPSTVIEPFLSQPLIVQEDELDATPRIMATQENRVVMAKGDLAYVRGDLKSDTSFQVFRPGRPLKDPVTGNIIGYEAAYLGTIKLERPAQAADEAHVFRIISVKEEMGIGDRLVPVPPATVVNYVPHEPESLVDARVVSVYGGVMQAGQNQIITVNKGSQDGLDVGTVLELYRHGTTVVDKTAGGSFWSRNKNLVKLPDQRYGTVFIFRVFKNISYGLIMQVTDTVQIADVARSPR